MNELTFNQKKPWDIKLPLSLSVTPVSGSSNIRVDIPVTSGRNSLQPRFSLVYNSSGGNSVFGMGWNLQGVLTIGLSLKKGLPRYDGSEKYSFGGKELIPWLNRIDGEWMPRKDENEEYYIDYYRATVDHAYTRFEKWRHKVNGQTHWRVHSRDNQVMVFGKSPDHSSRIHDPLDSNNVFQWLLESQFDNNGNGIHYEYIPEDLANVNGSLSFEWNRVYKREGNAQKYIKRVRYGNTRPVFPDDPYPVTLEWLFELVFDYGEHESSELPYYSTRTEGWLVREDPFSVYAGGFEQRTYRLCRRIMIFHHFAELGAGPTLVGSTRFEYVPNPAGTTLSRIHYNGYKRLEADRYETKALPPLVFTYTSPEVERSFRPAPEQSNANMPYGLGSMNYKWIDLYGEGLPGVLYESNECWYYKPNLGNGYLGEQQTVGVKPSLNLGSYTLNDFDGDGNLNLVILQGKESGYYEYNRDTGVWDGFKPFIASPHIRPADANTQFIDLTGDGRADIVTIEQDRIVWFPSKGKEGFEAPKQIAKAISNGVSRVPSIGPIPKLDYFFVNMSGSGLPDQVRVLNGRVEYWPNLGNGKFGTGVVMEDSPQFDFEFEFDANRVRLVDLDGSGTADLLYIGRGEIRYWINACGNRFVEGGILRGLPFIDNISSAQVLDFLGDGTPCLVWSTALSSHIDTPINYLRLTNGVRPRLLTQVQNSMGLETVYHYGYSGKHYLRDKQKDRPWITKLPTHRTVVDKAETLDHIANTRFTQWYEYHDGFFDSEERIFKGFCVVDQYDSEVYQGTTSVPEIEFSDPVCIRTWFHNGAPGWRNERTKSFYSDPFSIQLKDFEFEDVNDLGPEEFFHAVRSVSGQVIRTEVYGLDREGRRKANPFKINHGSFLVRRTQAGTTDHDPGFAVFQHTNLEMVYEEVAEDPKVTQIFNVLINDFGIPVLQASVAYPRISTDALPEQQQHHINAIQVAVDDIDILSRYEMIEWEKKTFEIKDDAYPAPFILYPVNDIFDLLQRTITTPLFHNEDFTGSEQSRLVQWTKTYYWNDAQTGVLPWRSAGTKTLVHHKEAACFPFGFLESVLGERYHPTTSYSINPD